MSSSVPFFDLGQQVRNEGPELHEALEQVLSVGYFVGGPAVEEFEQAYADFLGVKHVVGVANGLDAIRLALEVLGVGPGDEVLVPAFTYYATWLAVVQAGAIPVAVDVDHSTANIDVSLIDQAVTERTRAIVAVSLYGQAAQLVALRDKATELNIAMVEDCAQSHGAYDAGRMSGTVADVSAFSFYPTKNLGALGDAGAVATDDTELALRLKSRRSYGQGATKYDHVDTGWNSRLDPLQAAFLSLHLKKLPAWTARRQDIAKAYRNALSDAEPAVVVGPVDVRQSVWHHFVLRASDRAGLRSHFDEARIGTDVHYPYSFAEVKPMARYVADPSDRTLFPTARRLGEQVVSLPMGPWMSDTQVEVVVQSLERLPRELLAH